METRIPATKALAAVKAGPPAEPIDKQLRITAGVKLRMVLFCRVDEQ
jgi:hypothetical protein